eukprot:CAMPEP_0116862792 /NCGR_PEP_ID=MMETSP0418-20121206/23841_1 /TAXON_ID=1158023 /ORGANISM="Astrosyne radiata, Strain 13vi08-1A" /LENGTH=204 /DNA_ID=CAMNT_0004497697 /DNA_START=45 /DNA_END=659 /DNA_ORIENTATION=+
MPSFVKTPVLKNVYPKLVQWKKEYGHPNIPLGSTEGNQCRKLRQLHVQKKLESDEVSMLEEMGFRWNSLEDVYREADFDEMLQRLGAYREVHGDALVPKKYGPDPELGAWVTGIRRLGGNIDALDFRWVSNRQCGSQFMKKYRAFKERAEQLPESQRQRLLFDDKEVRDWIASQKQARECGELSETRQHYMVNLFGENWMAIEE